MDRREGRKRMKQTGAFATRLVGAITAAIGTALIALGISASCLCSLGPILALLGLSGVLGAFLLFDHSALAAGGFVLLALGIHLMFKHRAHATPTKTKIPTISKTYMIYMLAILIWNLLIFLTPYMASTGNSFADTLYSFFSYTCHQDPNRSLFLFNHQLPVCARDTAIYLGMLVGGLALPFIQDTKSRKIPPLWIFVLAMVPIGLDGVTQFLGLRESTNELRVITGGLIGIVIPFYLIPVLNFFAWKFGIKK